MVKGRKFTRIRLISKQGKKVIRKIAKDTVLRLAETKNVGKQLAATPSGGGQALFHNKVFYLGNLLACQQGTGDPNTYVNSNARIGDEILLKNINVRFLLSSFQPNTMYKMCLFWYENNTTLSDALVYFTQGSKLLDRYNTEEISIIDQKIIGAGTANRIPTELSGDGVNFGARRTQLATLNGHWKAKRIKYNEGTTAPKFKNIALVVVAYDSVNTLQTTQLGELVYDYKMSFKDI